MIKSVVIVCEDSPFGKNSVIESIRMATGLLAIGDLDNCQVIFMGDSVYFLNKDLNPEALNVDPFSNIMRLMELSDIEVYVHGEALNTAGLEQSDLISYENLKIVSNEEISQLILDANMTFKY